VRRNSLNHNGAKRGDVSRGASASAAACAIDGTARPLYRTGFFVIATATGVKQAERAEFDGGGPGWETAMRALLSIDSQSFQGAVAAARTIRRRPVHIVGNQRIADNAATSCSARSIQGLSLPRACRACCSTGSAAGGRLTQSGSAYATTTAAAPCRDAAQLSSCTSGAKRRAISRRRGTAQPAVRHRQNRRRPTVRLASS
jgi:hypothetical protein